MATYRQLASGNWQVQIRRKGTYLSETFRRHRDAQGWALEMERRIDRGESPKVRTGAGPMTFGDLIDLHLADMCEVGKAPRRSKAAVLSALKSDLGRVRLKDLARERLIDFGKARGREGAGPVTLAIDFGYIRTIIVHAAAVHGVDVSPEQVGLARAALKRLGLIGKGRERDRRPTANELERICALAESNPLQVIPLARIVRFAVATAMRQEEICNICWADLDTVSRTVLVRDRKDPRSKLGNDQKVPLLDVTGYDALSLLGEQRAASTSRGRVFPYNPRSVGSAFRRICRTLKIVDLHFHDLRHEGTSRLFEAGLDIPRVALVTGHKDWKMLRRYTNLSPADLHRHIAAQAEKKTPIPASTQAAFNSVMALIVEDVALGGAARFRGTSILVNPIAELLSQGVSAALMKADFPTLTAEMLAAAQVYRALSPTQLMQAQAS